MMNLRTLCLLGASTLLWACSGSPGELGDKPATTLTTPLLGHAPLLNLGASVLQIDEAGTVHINGRTFVPATDDDEYFAHPPPNKVVSDMSLEEVAWAVSPTLSYQNKSYRLAEPDYDLARAIQSENSLGVSHHIPGALPGGPNAAASPALLPTTRAPSVVNGPTLLPAGGSTIHPLDFYDPNTPSNPEVYATFESGDTTFVWPFSTIVYLQPSGCTGTYVGPHAETLLTALHCLRSHGVYAPYPQSMTPFASGTNGNPTTRPCGTFSGDYPWYYPTAWDTLNCGNPTASFNCSQYDYAVIDLSPGNGTTFCAGAMGIQEFVSNGPISGTVRVDGYPGWWWYSGSPPEPYGAPANPPYNAPCDALGQHINNPSSLYPFLCGEAGSASIASGWRIETGNIGANPGDSGAPFSINGYLAGMISSSYTYYDLGCQIDSLCSRNYGHAVDPPFWNMITTYAKL